MPRELTPAEIAEFREALLDAALRRFAAHGYAGVTLRGLAADLGCSPMTPYRYFRDKDAIFHALGAAAFERFGRHVEAAARRHREPIPRLRAISRAYVGFALAEPHAYRIMFLLDKQHPEPGIDPALEKASGRGWQVLYDTLAEAVAEGSLAGDPLTLGNLFWVSFHGAVSLHLAGRLPRFERSLEQLLEPLIELLIRGSAARPQERGGGAPCGASPSLPGSRSRRSRSSSG